MGKIMTAFRWINHFLPKGTEWGKINYENWCEFEANRRGRADRKHKYLVTYKTMRGYKCCAISKQKIKLA